MRAVSLTAALALAGCSPAMAPRAKTAGKVMSLSGVGGLILTSFAASYIGPNAREIVMGFSTLSAIGVGTYAAGDLSQPPPARESVAERHARWARVLTDRASGYARDGRCWRVRNIDPRVRAYDREHHKTVFMRDPEIVKCLTTAPLQTEPEPPAAAPPATPLDPPDL